MSRKRNGIVDEHGTIIPEGIEMNTIKKKIGGKMKGNDGFLIENFISRTKQFILGEDYVNQLENGITPTRSDLVDAEFDKYKDWVFIISIVLIALYFILGVLHLIFVLLASKVFSGSLYTFFTSASKVDMPQSLGSYNLWYIYIVYPFISILFLLYNVIMSRINNFGSSDPYRTIIKPQYFVEVLFIGVDWFFWFDMALSSSLLFWVLAQYSGMMDLLLIIMMIMINVVFCLGGGLGMEMLNDGLTAHTSRSVAFTNNENLKINWWPLIFGGLGPFLIICTGLFTFLSYGQISLSNGLIMQWIVLGLTFLFNLILLVTIFIRYAYAPLNYTAQSKEEREVEFIKYNGQFKLAKLIVNGIYRVLIMTAFFVELFLFL